MGALSEREVRILAFERNWWRQPGAKEQAIRDMLGMSATRYYQMLNELIDRPEALAFEPVLVKRLRRLMCGLCRRVQRTELGGEPFGRWAGRARPGKKLGAALAF